MAVAELQVAAGEALLTDIDPLPSRDDQQVNTVTLAIEDKPALATTLSASTVAAGGSLTLNVPAAGAGGTVRIVDALDKTVSRGDVIVGDSSIQFAEAGEFTVYVYHDDHKRSVHPVTVT